MRALKIILIIIVALLAIIIAIYAYYGGFKKINFTIKESGGEVVVYEELIGDYKNSALAMDKIYNSLKNDFGIESTKGIGIYYDNPQEVDISKLRCDTGCIIEVSDTAVLQKIAEKFRIKTLPLKNYLMTEFPFKGTMSIMVGIMRVYPALNKYATENNVNTDGPVTEIYDTPNKLITYRQELE